MSTANIAVLDELMKTRHEKKKKEPTVQEKRDFLNAWVELAFTEGFSERAEHYLYDGFAFGGAEPFKVYLSRAQDPNKELTALFTGKMYGKDASITFRLLTHLLALLLNEETSQNVLAPIIKRLPGASLNKERKRLGSAEKIIEKYFLAELDINAKLVPLCTVETKKVFIDEFAAMILSILEGIKHTGELKKKVITNIAKVEEWISDYVNSDGVIADTKSAPLVKESIQTGEIQKPLKKSNPKIVVEPATEEKAAKEDTITYFENLLKKINKTASDIRNESVRQKNEVDYLTKELQSEQEKARGASHQIAELQEKIVSLQQKLSAAENEVFKLKGTVEQKDALIAEKNTEIAERIRMIDVLGRDRSKQADEALQRIASKIRVEYKDFCDAATVPMSCDLGENLRIQLKNIFMILEKGGMKME